LNLHQLELFCSVVDYGSYVEAAKHLMITQPALSLQVKSLQTALGTKLFERRGNQIYLTEDGEIACNFARDILTLEQKLKSTLEEMRKKQHGNLAIGSSRPFQGYIMPYLVSNYLEQLENVQISVVYKDTESIYNQVLSKLLDIGIVTSHETIPLPPGLQATMLHHDHWCLVGRSDSPWASDRAITKHLFQSAPLISAVKHSVHWKLIQSILLGLGIREGEYTVPLRIEDLESIKTVVLSGLGIAFLPYASIYKELAREELVEFVFPDGKNPPLHSVIITQKNTRMRPSVQLFVDFLFETFPLRNEDA